MDVKYREKYWNLHANYFADNVIQIALTEVQYEEEQQHGDRSKQQAAEKILIGSETAR